MSFLLFSLLQMSMSRTGNDIRLIHTLLKVLTIHAYIKEGEYATGIAYTGHVKYFFRVGNQYAECEKQQRR